MKPLPEAAPAISDVREHYDRWNAACRSADFDDIEPEIRERADLILAALDAAELGRPQILEVGCGTGWLSGRLNERGSVTGIDLSPRAIEIAQQRGVPAKFMAADFLEADFAGQSYDAVICMETLFYVSEQEKCVERMAGLLRPGGWFGISCINKYVYERSSDIGPPQAGQLRHWLSIADTRKLISPWFDILSVQTVAPRGDQGLLRLVNSHKLNTLADRALTSARVRRLKERAGLGGGVVMIARRRDT